MVDFVYALSQYSEKKIVNNLFFGDESHGRYENMGKLLTSREFKIEIMNWNFLGQTWICNILRIIGMP